MFGAVENSLQEGDVVLLYQPEEFKLETDKIASN
jgi:hypothetical protein